MSCQACVQRAQHEAVHGPLRARCCSERCGRAIFAGLTQHDDGTVHIAAASPLGCAIARKTCRTGDHRLPASLVATLIGALQRVGPEQSDAAAAASTDAPNWAAELPAEVWADILRRVAPSDVAVFARASRDAQDLANMRLGPLNAFRRKYTSIRAAKAYAAKLFTDDFQPDIARRAYPKIAEMALIALILYDFDGADAKSISQRAEELLGEIGADERELYLRPLAMPVENMEFGYQWKRAPTTAPIMLAALRYCTNLTNRNRLPLLKIDDTVDAQPMETPESMPLLMIPQCIGATTRHLANLESPITLEAKFGISITHYNAVVSMHYPDLWRAPYDEIRNEIAVNPRLHFGYQRTIVGQPSNLYLLFRQTPYGRIDECIELMHLKGQFVHCCLEPAFFNVTTRPSILANLPASHEWRYKNFVVNVAMIPRAELAAAGVSAANLFSRYDNNKMLPFHYYIQDGGDRAYNALFLTNETPIDPMVWRPFAPLGDTHVPFLALQPMNAQHRIVTYLRHKSTDDKFNTPETMLYVAYLCRNHESITGNDEQTVWKLCSMVYDIVMKVTKDTVQKNWAPKLRYYSIIKRTTLPFANVQRTMLLAALRK